MKKTKQEFIVGAFAGFAGTLAKRLFYQISIEKDAKTGTKAKTFYFRLPEKRSQLPDEKRGRNWLDFGLGTLGGIGTYYLQKSRGRTEGLAGSFTFGTFSDSISKENIKRNWSMRILANAIYGLTTTLLNVKLSEQFLPEHSVEECVKEIKLRTKKMEKENESLNGKLKKITKENRIKLIMDGGHNYGCNRRDCRDKKYY